jgi:tripeptide aminopeptidase
MPPTVSAIESALERLPDLRTHSLAAREILLANLIMLGEIPAPTFEEEARQRCLQDRFVMAGLQNCSTDEVGNVYAIRPGTAPEEERENILLVAHADTFHAASEDHTVSVQSDTVSGLGLGDNALGMAVLATLPMLLDALGIEFKRNLILMGASRSLGLGNLEGLKFFLENKKLPVAAGISLEGFRLGRLSYSSTGMLRGRVSCRVPEEFDWTMRGTLGAVQVLNDVISRICEIPLPQKPRTNIILGQVRGGRSFNRIALRGSLSFEIRSDSAEIVERIRRRIEGIVDELTSQSGVDVLVDFFAERSPGALPFDHPLVESVRAILERLGIEARNDPSISELSAFLDRDVPAITVGLTTGDKHEDEPDLLKIDPIFDGVAQLLALLLSVDGIASWPGLTPSDGGDL